MASGFVIRKNQYYDSVFLMSVNRRISEVKGVQQTAVLMGSPTNKQLLLEIGVQDDQIKAALPNDLIVAVIAETPAIVENILGRLDEWLEAIQENTSSLNVRTLEEGLSKKPNANLAVISVPGEYAAREAKIALKAGLNVFLFSDNVSIEDELELKKFSAQQGLLVMGPDCGTSLIGGVGIGFANVVRRGPIGAIGAAGTGLQEFTSQVNNAGSGISHAIGTGSHDLSEKIAGLTTLSALDALDADKQTRVIAIISKPPAPSTLATLIKRIETCKKPVVGCFLGVDPGLISGKPNLQSARTIDDAVRIAITCSNGQAGLPAGNLTHEELDTIHKEKKAWSSEQKYLRGILAGGTFCYQSQQILREAGYSLFSNSPFDQKYRLADPDHSIEHTIVDMGDDYYTVGKPHPMIDGTLRKRRILVESHDPRVAVLYLDFILGYNASMDPVGELLDAILEAKRISAQRGGALTIVASVCGTETDPQDINFQIKMLTEAGVLVFRSNALASAACCELLEQG
jgi:succinyl-CoA synthetase alpha subunit